MKNTLRKPNILALYPNANPIIFSLIIVGLAGIMFGCDENTGEQKPGSPPTASATVQQGASGPTGTITLDGTGSSDPDGDSLSYEWTVQDAPFGDTPAPVSSNAMDSIAYHNVNEEGNYVFQLTVNDGVYDPVSDTVHYEAIQQNNPPVAVVPDDMEANVDEEVELDGSGSSDPDGDELTYTWTLTGKPSQSEASITNADQAIATITPDLAGDYFIELLVADPDNKTDNAKLTLTVSE